MAEKARAVEGLFDLTGRVAVVAGGAGYLGSAVCRGLLHHGAKVIVADINIAQAEHLVDELNGRGDAQRSWSLPLDISREDSICHLVDGVHSDFKRLDILVNATCAPHGKSLTEISADSFNRSLSANVTGSFLLARQAKTQ